MGTELHPIPAGVLARALAELEGRPQSQLLAVVADPGNITVLHHETFPAATLAQAGGMLIRHALNKIDAELPDGPAKAVLVDRLKTALAVIPVVVPEG